MPLVLLHGFLGLGSDWRGVRAHLPPRVPTLAPDLPGHGTTPLTEPPSYAAWVRWLEALLDARGWPRVTLAGYSLGGRVALAFAACCPQRVARLVLVSAHPGLTDPAQREARAQADAARASFIRSRGLAAFLEDWYRLPLFGLEGRDALRRDLIARRSRQQADAMAAVVEAMSPGVQPPLWGALVQLPVPVVYVAGARDAKYAALADRMAAFPHVQAVRVADAAHMVHLDAPQRVAGLLAEPVGAA